ncbi:unnamed protein product [Brachionus calyciflorus]|uniref:Uncharacterized protein n=1 Tax=Brachionus calyciflorus TaxID=104777 RepID=A0A814H9V7_9BILA|nr:unnamed protein product [Brachionus calyciflorus]
MRKLQENQKRQDDSKVKDQIKFDKGDLVILVNTGKRQGQVRNFEPKFISPYKILEQVTEVNFKFPINNRPWLFTPIDCEKADVNNQILMQALVNNRPISVPNVTNNNKNVMNVNNIVPPVIVEIDLNNILSETLADLINEMTEKNQVRTSNTRNIQQIDSINESRLNKNLIESQLEASSDESEKSEEELGANFVTAEEAKLEKDLPPPDKTVGLTRQLNFYGSSKKKLRKSVMIIRRNSQPFINDLR